MRNILVLLCVATLTLGTYPQYLLSQSNTISGTLAGAVYTKGTRGALEGVTITARPITSNDSFYTQSSDTRGSYVISNVPPGIYAFTLEYEGIEYPVQGQFDARAPMDFLLETCFQVDIENLTTAVLPECRSPLYSDTQIVSLGPNRFFRPETSPLGQETAQTVDTLEMTHSGLTCIIRDQFPQMTAGVSPEEQFQSGRVYFRAAQEEEFYYYVMMQGEGSSRYAILPKPAPQTTEIVYYIEGVGVDYNPVILPTHQPEVTDEETCRRREPEAAYFPGTNPGITVGATVAGASAFPPSFLADGITSFISSAGVITSVATAGAVAGGLGTTGLVLVIAGATAGGIGIVLALTGDEASPIIEPQP
jgi:hypothetical protein